MVFVSISYVYVVFSILNMSKLRLWNGMMCVLLGHMLHVHRVYFWKREFDNSWNKAHHTEIRKNILGKDDEKQRKMTLSVTLIQVLTNSF